jgi:hypothetical protein
VDRNDSVGGLAEGEGAKKERVHQAEDDGVGSDAEAERQKRGRGEAARFRERSERDAYVLDHLTSVE